LKKRAGPPEANGGPAEQDSLETDARAQAHRPGILDLENRPRSSRAVAAGIVALRRRVGLPLQDRV
jgi:hypothetical protein